MDVRLYELAQTILKETRASQSAAASLEKLDPPPKQLQAGEGPPLPPLPGAGSKVDFPSAFLGRRDEEGVENPVTARGIGGFPLIFSSSYHLHLAIYPSLPRGMASRAAPDSYCRVKIAFCSVVFTGEHSLLALTCPVCSFA